MGGPHRQKRVLIVLNLASTAGRRHLEGVLRYVNTVGHWNIRIVGGTDDFTQDALDREIGGSTDGIFCVSDRRTSKILSRADVPLAIIDYANPMANVRSKRVAIAVGADEANGASAARYLRSLGDFRTYAFVPDASNRSWSRLRERGYRRELARHGIEPVTFCADRQSMPEWLSGLEKPTAVFAAYDFLALEVLGTCRRLGLSVPEHVAVLGVDNDEVLCENSAPPLSSISLDHLQEAYDLAKALDRLMSSGKRPARTVLTGLPGKIQERDSTKYLAASAHLVRKALQYIKAKATSGITAASVVMHLGVSKTVAYAVFSEYSGTTIHRAIEDERIKKLTDLLRTSDMSIKKVSSLAGFLNHQRAKYVFKSRFGMSMREWRRQNT